MIAVNYRPVDRLGALAAYEITANGQNVGEVRQLAGGSSPGTWLAVPPEGTGTSLGGFRKRTDAVEHLLDRIGALG